MRVERCNQIYCDHAIVILIVVKLLSQITIFVVVFDSHFLSSRFAELLLNDSFVIDLPTMFRLVFQSAPIGLVFGQIAYRDDTRQWNFYFFNLSTITVITILPKTGQNTENTTFLHVKMTAFRACPAGKSYQNRFLWTIWS